MATRVRVQRVDRKNSRSFYVNLPVVLVEAIGVQKGDDIGRLCDACQVHRRYPVHRAIGIDQEDIEEARDHCAFAIG